jgi:hypothetical protein
MSFILEIDHLTATANVATVIISTPEFSKTVESKVKRCRIQYIKFSRSS